MKLNLGCGQKILDGYVNVDKYGNPDLLFNLETFPWPWADSSVEEILLSHVLEHLGQSSDVFLKIIQEIYRVCTDRALVRIDVPHPRSDHYLGDPTHVRPINRNVMSLFSKRLNREWIKNGAANTPLAMILDVDFEIEEVLNLLGEPWESMHQRGELSKEQLATLEQHNFNVVLEISMKLRVIKPS